MKFNIITCSRFDKASDFLSNTSVATSCSHRFIFQKLSVATIVPLGNVIASMRLVIFHPILLLQLPALIASFFKILSVAQLFRLKTL